MADITKLASKIIPSTQRTQVFNGGDAVQGDILLVKASLGKSARLLVIDNTSSNDLSLRFNVHQTVYPRRGPNNGLDFTDHYPNLALPIAVLVEDAEPLVIGNGETLTLDKGVTIDDIQIVNLAGALVGAEVFTGAGLDDLTSSGTYVGTTAKEYVVRIDANGTPDTFEWSNDGGATFGTTGVGITGGAQVLEDGVTVTFGATVGHTIGDLWTFTAGGGGMFEIFVA